jgi:hypothetical protein
MVDHAIINEISFDDSIEIDSIEDVVSNNLADFSDIVDNYAGTVGHDLWADNREFY